MTSEEVRSKAASGRITNIRACSHRQIFNNQRLQISSAPSWEIKVTRIGLRLLPRSSNRYHRSVNSTSVKECQPTPTLQDLRNNKSRQDNGHEAHQVRSRGGASCDRFDTSAFAMLEMVRMWSARVSRIRLRQQPLTLFLLISRRRECWRNEDISERSIFVRSDPAYPAFGQQLKYLHHSHIFAGSPT